MKIKGDKVQDRADAETIAKWMGWHYEPIDGGGWRVGRVLAVSDRGGWTRDSLALVLEKIAENIPLLRHFLDKISDDIGSAQFREELAEYLLDTNEASNPFDLHLWIGALVVGRNLCSATPSQLGRAAAEAIREMEGER